MVKLLAYYLPQYHPIQENDKWWGKGFTEWRNVTKAKPLFNGHYQPRLPADLGFYDLRVPEVRAQQAKLASEYGVDGFCYYHYWFGNGKMLLERPLEEVVASGEPDFPFCICWTNETWKGIWFGAKGNEVLIEQEYPGKSDYIEHFNYLKSIFEDKRYIKISGKCLFNVYRPYLIPDLEVFVNTFKECAAELGIDLYFVATRAPISWNPKEHGFDAVVGSEFVELRYAKLPETKFSKIKDRIINYLNKSRKSKFNFEERKKPLVVEYVQAIQSLLPKQKFDYIYFPCVINDWDNTARSGKKGVVLNNSTPELFERHLSEAFEYVIDYPENEQLIFVKSWNEWAEGNYLEPDLKWGHSYLEIIKRVKSKFSNFKSDEL